MPVNTMIYINITILLLALVYYKSIKIDFDKTSAYLGLFGALIGYALSLVYMNYFTSNAVSVVLSANVSMSVFSLLFIISLLTLTSKKRSANQSAGKSLGYMIPNNYVGQPQTTKTAAIGFIEQSVEALNNENYSLALDLLEKAVKISSKLNRELKIRKELAFALLLAGEDLAAREQLEDGLNVAEDINKSWARDLSRAIERLNISRTVN